MKTYMEKYALAMPKIGHQNRKRHSRLKTILSRIAVTLAIGAATYYLTRHVG
jgi:hypothetical protein